MKIFEMLNLDAHYFIVISINLLAAIILLVSIKYISGWIANVNATDELKEKDNAAFGISIFAVMLSISIMMTGVVSGGSDEIIANEAISVVTYGVLGLVLMFVTRFVFDKFTMPNISIKDEIKNGNMAVAIIDAGNVLATAIIIRSIMVWIETEAISGVIFVCIGYIISQIVLVIATIYRKKIFNKTSSRKMHDLLLQGNMALAFRFSGYRIAIAFAIASTSGIVPFSTENILTISILWLVISVIMIVIISLLSLIAHKIILKDIDNNAEIREESNIAIGLIEGGISICIALLVASLTI